MPSASGPAPPPERHCRDGGTAVKVALHGTVRRWDDVREVVLDDGSVVTVSADAALAGYRLLHPGQRVRLDLDDHGTVTRVTWP